MGISFEIHAPKTIFLLSFAAAIVASAARLPTWPPSYAMRNSTFCMPSNATGFFDPHLAAQFGLVSFDNGNAAGIWGPNVVAHSHSFPSLPTSEELLVEQCRQVKRINPHTKCFVYRNGELALQWFSSEAERMYNATWAALFLHAAGTSSGPGTIYNEPTAQGRDQYFWNFSNPDMADFWVDRVVMGPNGGANGEIDGFFVDDSQALGSEHGDVAAKCGMSAAAVARWNQDAKAAYGRGFDRLVAGGKFAWNLMVDPDGKPAFTTGQSPPFPATMSPAQCTAWMTAKCAADFSAIPLMLSPEVKHRDGLVPPGMSQALAAFLLIRGPYAW